MSKPFVSQIEGGRRAGTASTLKKLAKTLGVPLGVLVVERDHATAAEAAKTRERPLMLSPGIAAKTGSKRRKPR